MLTQTKKLKQLITLVSGQHVNAELVTESPEGKPYLTGPSDFDGKYVKKAKYTNHGTKFCREGDILITVKGSGAGTMAWSNDQYAIGRQLMAIRGLNFDTKFLWFCLEFQIKKISSKASGTIPGLSRSDIHNIEVPIPPIAEQKKIAEILGTCDRQIELTENLINAKRTLKRGLMQKLLTGKLRFPEFEGSEWKLIKLGKLFTERSEKNREDLPLLSVTGSQGVVLRDELERRDTSSADKGNYKRVNIGDIVYNTMRMWQGRSGLSGFEGIVSPAYTVITPEKNIDANYFKHLFKLPSVIFIFQRYSQGLVSDTWNLKFRNFSKIKIVVPALDEQKKIAACLDAVDKEISSASSYLFTLQQQKKSLMQQLLTGKTRVKVD